MANLVSILGENWQPPPANIIDPPELQLYKAMMDAGLEPPDEIIIDGNLRRFKSGTKGKGGFGDKTGWYVAFPGELPAGRFGCWRADIDHTWRADIGRKFSPAEEMQHARRMAEAKAKRDEERKRTQDIASDTVDRIWSGCIAASAEHPYLKRKGIGVNGARITGDGRLVVPLFDDQGCLASLQYISQDGQKLYHPGGKTGGCFWTLGAYESGTIYIAEGFATAATIHEVTNSPCVVAYSASNLVPVCGTVRARYPDAKIVVVADHDASGVGQKYADQCSAKYAGVKVVMPPIAGDANDFHMAGNDLMNLLEPPNAESWFIPASDLTKQPAPVSWIVKHWLQSDALIMIHGPSGGGKTFCILDLCLRVAAGIPDWHGNKVKPGCVAYLAGEGHLGLRGRIAAWKQHFAPDANLNFFLTRSGCDLNLNSGLTKAVEEIRALPDRPSIIVVDTLHRFMAGDENSAQDAKTMLDSCSWLMREFSPCSVILVHHTGVSDDAQHRARGSSAWRGALDIEISVTPGDDIKPLGMIQRKSKDAELAQDVYLTLKPVPIAGWLDEDGEQVTSAILEPADAPAKPKKDSKLDGYRQTIEAAWWHCGAEMVADYPYISRSWLKDKLRADGMKEKAILNSLSPGDPRLLIGALTASGIISPHADGWLIKDESIASALRLMKSQK